MEIIIINDSKSWEIFDGSFSIEVRSRDLTAQQCKEIEKEISDKYHKEVHEIAKELNLRTLDYKIFAVQSLEDFAEIIS